MMVRCVAALAVALIALPAAAQEPAAAERAGARAAAAEARLSDVYAGIWGRLDGVARDQFAAAERRWLNRTRWDEHAACVASHATPDQRAVTECRATVALRRLEWLEHRQLASRS